MVVWFSTRQELLSWVFPIAVQADTFWLSWKIKLMPLGFSQVLVIQTSLGGGFNRKDVVLKVSLVSDIPSWEVSGHHEGRTIWCSGLTDT